MNVLLIDDHALFREGLALLLAPLVPSRSVWQAASCEEALKRFDGAGAPDLALVDLGLPGMPGIQGLAVMRECWPRCALVAVSSADDRDTVLRAIDAGAMGFIPKSASSTVLHGALQLILDGSIYLPPSAFLGRPRPPPLASGGVLGDGAGRVLPRDPRDGLAHIDAAPAGGIAGSSPGVVPEAGDLPGRDPAEVGITPRQADVLYLLLQGKPAKLIERELGLSTSTVKAHTSAVLRALNVTSRTQAVIEAGRLGLRFAPAAASSRA